MLRVFCFYLLVRLGFLKSPTFLIATVVIVFVCALEKWQWSGFRKIEMMTYDWRVKLAHRYRPATAANATNLALVEVSDNTIYEVKYDRHLGYGYGLYWPRDVYAGELKELTDEGARAVAFDVLFAEERDDQGQVATPDGTIMAPDDIFAEQLRKSSNAVIAADRDQMPASKFRTNAWRVGSMSVERDTVDGVLRKDRAFQDYYVWHPFIEQFAGISNLNLSLTVDDRKKREINFFTKKGIQIQFATDENGQIAVTNFISPAPEGMPEKFAPYELTRVWSMGIVLAAAELHLDLDHPKIEPGKLVLTGSNGVVRTIPIDEQNSYYIDWSLKPNDPQIYTDSFESLLRKKVDRKHKAVSDDFRGKLVMVGSTATGNDLTDTGSTPLDNHTFLVIKHLNVANGVITGTFVKPTSMAINLLLIMLVGLFASWITWVAEKAHTGTILMVAFAAVYCGMAAGLYMEWRIWIPIFLPILCAGFVTHGCTLIYRVRFEQSQKRLIKQLFSRVLSPDVVNEVLTKEEIRISGQRREITVYFADVRGFTELTDVTQAQAEEYVKKNNLSEADATAYFDLHAKDTLDTVNAYLTAISDVVKEHKGTLDKYIGDCVMAFWGSPLPDPQHALLAVRAAIGAQRAMAALNVERAKQNKLREEENVTRLQQGLPALSMLPILSMGTGINTGASIVGFMGSEDHLLNYTAFGREVNLASRLEGVSGHGRIIIGEATYEQIIRDEPQMASLCLEWPPRTVKGFQKPVRIYEVIWQPASGDAKPAEATAPADAKK